MKRFTFAVVISLVLHALVIFMLTGADMPLSTPGAGSGVTRATFVTIDTGPGEDVKGEEGNQKAAPAEEPVEEKDSVEELSQETPEAVTEPEPPKRPEPEVETLVKAEKEPLEKVKEAPVKETAPEPETKKPQERKTAPEPVKKEPESGKTQEKQDKKPIEEPNEETEGEQPGEIPAKTEGPHGKPGDNSSKKESSDSGASDSAEESNQVHDIAVGDITRRVPPGYPRASRLRREEGKVVIIAETRGGKVVSLSVENSSGHQRLDRSALEAVKKWEFGFTEERTVRIPVIFRLRN